MKKIAFAILAITLTNSYYAQLSKGTFMPGAGINYYYDSTSNHDTTNKNYSSNKISSLNLHMKFGYFITNKIVIGIIGGYRKYSGKSTSEYTSSNRVTNSSKQISNTVYTGLFLRSYKITNNGKFGFFGQLTSVYGIGKTLENSKYTNDGIITLNNEYHKTSNSFDVNLSAGVVYFVHDKIGIEASFGAIGYNRQSNKSYDKSKQTGYGNETGFYTNFSMNSIQLGVNYYLGRKKA